MGNKNVIITSVWAVIMVLRFCSVTQAQKPNVLFISIDDLNDWTGELLGGGPLIQYPTG